jgi:hypothetical protein
MSTFRKPAGVLLAMMTVLGLTATPAVADPQKGLVIEQVCDNGNTYSVIQQAGQDWNALLDTDGTSAFHLTWSTINYVLTAPDGTVTVYGPFESAKGGSDRDQKDLLNCSYSFEFDGSDGIHRLVFGLSRGWLTPSSG